MINEIEKYVVLSVLSQHNVGEYQVIKALEKKNALQAIVLITTASFQKEEKALIKLLGKISCPIYSSLELFKTLKLNGKNYFEDKELMKSALLILFEKFKGTPWLFNCTGGTKSLILGLETIFSEYKLNNAPFKFKYAYTGEGKNALTIWEGNEKPKEERLISPTLIEQISLYQTVVEEGQLTRKPEYLTKEELIKFRQIYQDTALIKFAAPNTPEKIKLKVQKLGLDDLLFDCSDEKVASFILGGWLEVYTFICIKNSIMPDDIAINIKIANDNKRAENEIDIAFLKNGRFHVVECKSGFFDNIYANILSAMYKLQNVGSRCGNATCYLVLTPKIANKVLNGPLGPNNFSNLLANARNYKSRLIFDIENGFRDNFISPFNWSLYFNNLRGEFAKDFKIKNKIGDFFNVIPNINQHDFQPIAQFSGPDENKSANCLVAFYDRVNLFWIVISDKELEGLAFYEKLVLNSADFNNRIKNGIWEICFPYQWIIQEGDPELNLFVYTSDKNKAEVQQKIQLKDSEMVKLEIKLPKWWLKN